MKRILLCCGTGVATSTVVNKKLAEELKKRGHGGDFTITQCKAAEVPGQSSNYIILNRGVEEIYNNIEKALWGE